MGVSYKVPPTRLLLKDDDRLVPFLLWLFAGGRNTSIWDWLSCRFDAATRTLVIPGGWEKAAATPYEELMDCVLPLLDRRQPTFTAVLRSEDQGDGPSIRRWRYRASSIACDFKNRYSEHQRDVWIADREQRIDAEGRWWERLHAIRGVRHMSPPAFGRWRELVPFTADSLLANTKLTLKTDAMAFEARYGSPNLLLAQWRVALEEEVGRLEGAQEDVGDPERAVTLRAVAYLCRSGWTQRYRLSWLDRTEGAPMGEAFGELLAIMQGRPQLRPETVAELQRLATSAPRKAQRASSAAADKARAAAHVRGLARAALALNVGDSAALAASFEDVKTIDDWAARPEWMALLRRAPELGMSLPVAPPAGVEKKLWSWIRGNTRADPGPDLRDDVGLDDLATNVRMMAFKNARSEAERKTATREQGEDARAEDAGGAAADEDGLAGDDGDTVARTAAPRWFEAELLAMPIGQTPSWEQGYSLIDRLAETPLSQWTHHRELEVDAQEPATMAAGLRAVLKQLQREWDEPQHYMRIRNVGGRDVLVTGDWVGNGAGPEANSCNRVRLLEWAGVAAALGFVED